MTPALIPKTFEEEDQEKRLRSIAERSEALRREGLHLLIENPSLRLDPRKRGLIGRIDKKPWWADIPRLPIAEKIVFLNKENLQHFEGYKASVEIHEGRLGRHQVHIVLTDFSLKSAKNLLDVLKAMNPAEVYGDNK